MSKFKVGDKVKRGRYEGIITDIKTKTTYTMTTEREGTYSNLSDECLKHLETPKSPHQELLDLGWELHKKLHGSRYYRKGDYFIYINTKEKSYKIDSNNLEDVPNITLQLAKILVRYLEELE